MCTLKLCCHLTKTHVVLVIDVQFVVFVLVDASFDIREERHVIRMSESRERNVVNVLCCHEHLVLIDSKNKCCFKFQVSSFSFDAR